MLGRNYWLIPWNIATPIESNISAAIDQENINVLFNNTGEDTSDLRMEAWDRLHRIQCRGNVLRRPADTCDSKIRSCNCDWLWLCPSSWRIYIVWYFLQQRRNTRLKWHAFLEERSRHAAMSSIYCCFFQRKQTCIWRVRQRIWTRVGSITSNLFNYNYNYSSKFFNYITITLC